MAKRKSKKRQFTKTLSLILIVFVAIISLIFYLNPGLYNNLIDLINKGDTNSLISNINRDNYYAKENNPFLVHFIDIGQGDAIFIEFPDNKTMLIDSGDNKSENNNTLVNYILDLGVETIDYVVATHADADHIGGMDNIFYNFNVKKVFRPYIKYKNTSSTAFTFTNEFNQGSLEHGTKTYGTFLQCILDEKFGNNLSCEWEFFTCDSDFANSAKYNDKEYKYTFDFLTPTKSLTEIDEDNNNNYSPIVMLEYCGFKMIFTGDAEVKVENEFVNKYKTQTSYVDCDVLKVGHHGSDTSSSTTFLDLIKPERAVIPCGTGNTYGHPHQVTLNNLLSRNCNVYRTDTNGHILIKVNKDGEPSVTYEKGDVSTNYVAP